MGLDGNTYKVHNEDFQGVEDFNGFLKKEGLASCWEPAPNPLSPTTVTCYARSHPTRSPTPETCLCSLAFACAGSLISLFSP
eukprot:3936753-Rhodomonas_salina.1